MKSLTVAVMLGVMCATSAAYAREAVVTGKMVRIRKDPNVTSVALEAVGFGEKVEIVDAPEGPRGWLKVKFKKTTGYMSEKYLGVSPDSAARMSFSLPLPSEGPVQGPRVVEIKEAVDPENKIRSQIDSLTASLSQEGKEPDIKSIVVIYGQKDIDKDKASLRDETRSIKEITVAQAKTIELQAGEIKSLKEMLAEKEKAVIDKSRLEGEIAGLKESMASKAAGNQDISELKKMVADLHKEMRSHGAPPVVESPDVVQLRKTADLFTRMPDFKLVTLVEKSGEEVFLKGVGNVKMAVNDDLAIFKVPKGSVRNAEKIFSHLLKRMVDGGEVMFFICDRDLVQQGDEQSRKKG